MTLIRVLKALAKPALWLAKYAVWGLSIVGLSMHGRPYQSADTVAASPDPDPEPAARTVAPAPAPFFADAEDDLASVRSLTPDELLWQTELE